MLTKATCIQNHGLLASIDKDSHLDSVVLNLCDFIVTEEIRNIIHLFILLVTYLVKTLAECRKTL